MPLGRAGIDSQDARVVMRAPDHADVKESGYVAVGVELGGSFDVPEGVGALPRLADLFEIFAALVAEIALVYIHYCTPCGAFWPEALLRAAERTALIIGS
jgi:hypothetical protein